MNKIFSKVQQILAFPLSKRPTPQGQTNISAIFSRQVYDLVAEMAEMEMITPPNPSNLPMGLFEFRCGANVFEVHLRSINGVGGVDDDIQYDTGVDALTVISRWRIPEASMDQLNTWNSRHRSCYAIKDDDFVEVINAINLFRLEGCRKHIIENTIWEIVLDTKHFVQYIMSRH